MALRQALCQDHVCLSCVTAPGQDNHTEIGRRGCATSINGRSYYIYPCTVRLLSAEAQAVSNLHYFSVRRKRAGGRDGEAGSAAGGGGGGGGGGGAPGEGEAVHGGAGAAVPARRLPHRQPRRAQHGHQQARLHRLPQRHLPRPPRPLRLLPREEGQAAADLLAAGGVLRAGAHRDHGEPGVLPAGAVPPVADLRLRDPEHGAGHHLRAGGRAPAGAGGPGQAARGGQGGGHSGEHRWCHGDHALQGPAALQPQPARAGGPDLDLRQPHLQLDPRLRLHPRPLPLLVRLDGAPGARAQAVPGAAVGDLAHLRLRAVPVPRHRGLHRGGPEPVEGAVRRGALHHPLRRSGGLRRGLRTADLVHRPRRPALHRRLPARPDRRRRRHGRHHTWRPALHRRDHRRGADRHRALLRAVGQERGEEDEEPGPGVGEPPAGARRLGE